MDSLLKAAESKVDTFRRAVAEVEYIDRGVDNSEMMFLYACVGDLRPRQIIESGRALGRSTCMLGKLFPETPVLSIERDADGSDVDTAIARLKPLTNVACLFGDSRTLVPELALPGDVVMIDGPKELRALKLAMLTIRRKQPAVVLIHDCYRGSTIRRFLDAHVSGVIYSDDRRWVERYHELDDYLDPAVRRQYADPATAPADRSYGGTFACLPTDRTLARGAGRLRLALAELHYKLIGRRRQGEHTRIAMSASQSPPPPT